ncbi:P-loop containing nucleoside triphosphate hydrolase protein [Crassisporium funariophilum]|nr:P-loop containing nucleoside triphosphate hydrolase protein [Crassisporium funariophilum]
MARCNADGEEGEMASKDVFIVVMGVSGTGKSTLGSALAKELDVPYVEGDDLHPKSNVDKMSAGHPLTDADREPWLELIRKTAETIVVEQHADVRTGRKAHGSRGVVISCSALKKYYRDILRGHLKPASRETQRLPEHMESAHPDALPTYFVFIDGPRDVLVERMKHRSGHFMKVSMLDSQLQTLESPAGEEGVVVVSLEASTEEQIKVAKKGLPEIPKSHCEKGQRE